MKAVGSDEIEGPEDTSRGLDFERAIRAGAFDGLHIGMPVDTDAEVERAIE